MMVPTEAGEVRTTLEKSKTVMFWGIPFLDLSADQVDEAVFSLRKGGACIVTTPNIDHLCSLDDLTDSSRRKYLDAGVFLCDSRIVRLASRMFGSTPLEHLNTGSDLTVRMLTARRMLDYRVLVIGSDPAAIEVLSSKLNHRDMFCHRPPMGFIEDEDAVEACYTAVETHQPHFIFLAVGFPRSELLAHYLRGKLRVSDNQVKAILNVGASIDFMSGRQKRAPILLQQLSLEWLYRLVTDYSRLAPRYWKNFKWLVRRLIRS